MDRGFICLWRRVVDSQVFQDLKLWKVWTWCLLTATHKKRWVQLKVGKADTIVLLKPGQFIFGRNRAAKSLKIKPSTVWYKMKKLEEMRSIDIQSYTHYSVVTVCNWAKYQTDRLGVRQPKLTAVRQPSDTDNNVNNVNNEKNKKKKKTSATNDDGYPVDLVLDGEE